MKKLQLLKRTLLLFALIVGCVNYGWAETVTFDFTTADNRNTITWDATGTSGTGSEVNGTKSGVNFVTDCGYMKSDGTYMQVYANSTYFTISAGGGTITSFTITCTANGNNNYGPKKFSGTGYTGGTGKTGTWSGSSTSVTLTNSAQVRISSIEVTYTPAAVKKNTTLTLSPTSLSFSYGDDEETLTATVTPEGESALKSPTISWSSDNLAVATVDNGVVTPVGEGYCNITATYDGDNDYNGSNSSASVTVSDNRTAVVSAITSINSIKGLYIGGKHPFTPVVTLADGLSESDVTYSYVSADPATIQINDDGTYTALKTGTDIDVTVTVTPIEAKLATHKPVSATFQHNGVYKYSKPIFTPTGVTEGNFSGSMTLEMANDGTPIGPIYYTLDGEDPATDKSNGTLYENELTLTATKTVKARVIDNDGYYSTVTSATYTKVPANKDAISIPAGQSLSFASFSNAGAYTDHVTDNVKTVYFLSSDGDNYKFTGVDFGSYSNSSYRLQLKSTTGTMTSGAITSANGFKMTLNVSNSGSASVKVYVGETEKTAVDGAYYFSSGDAVTIKRNTGTPQISNITFTALKPTRSVSFEDGDQKITVDGETITKTATISPAGTATYTSSDTDVATVNATTGEVTAVKGGSAVITATVAADEDYEKSTGSYTVTVNKAATTLAFAHAEETVELVDGTATFTATATPADGTRVITYSSDDDITVNSSTGVVTLTETGDFVIKANAAATDKYLAPSEASYILHVQDSRVPIVDASTLSLSFEGVASLNNMSKGATGTISVDYTKATGFVGTETVSIVSSDDDVRTIVDDEFEAQKGGVVTVTVTITSGGNNMFTTVVKEFEVTVVNSSKTATEITIEPSTTPINTTYGDDATELLYDVTAGYEGEVTYALSNSNIVDVVMSAGTATITPKAAGTTTLTFSAVETANYSAADDVVLTINVAEPTASTSTPDGEDYWVYQNTLLANSLPSGWTGDGEVWYAQSKFGAVTTTGKTSGTYDLYTDVDATGYKNVGVTFDHTGNNLSDIASACNVYVKVGSNDPEKLTITNFTSDGNWNYVNSGEIALGSDYDNTTIRFIFRYTPTSGNNGKWEVKNFKVYGTEIPSETVTVASSGFSTYCYQYPLDLDLLDEDVKAYIVTDVSDNDVTFKRVTGTIKGGVPFILYGTAGEHTLYTAASSTNVPKGNMLVGTLAPTYITATNGDYTNFGLKNGKFVKATNGVIGANKAYLPILTSSLANGAHEFNIVFDEGETTAISEVRGLKSDVRGEFYNLNGQRVATPVKGNIYIVNGKKVMFK